MTQASMLAFDFAALTDVGCKRTNNEDSFGYDVEQQLFVVCDGMGGSAAGEVASNLAVRALIESYGLHTNNDSMEDRIERAIHDANRAVFEAAAEDPELEHMGTTLVCTCLEGDRAVIGNVGDSRAYLIREGSCSQITRDHSFLSEEIEKGNITPEMAAASNLQSVITRAIGVGDSVDPDLFGARLLPGDVLLLASDGLTRYASTDEIAAAVSSAQDLAGACHALIEHAKESGGADNITCILLRAVEALPPGEGMPVLTDTPAS
jgi:protein phosphatase